MPTVVSSQAVVKKIKMYCALFGRPDEIMTDNGPQYAAETLQTFTKEWGIVHITSSPHYARSNGFIERHVRHVKPIIRKALKQGDDIQRALLNLHATPVDTRLPSPGEMLFGRPMTTILPSHGLPGPEDQRQHMVSNQTYMKEHYDQSSGPELLPLYTGQQIRIIDKVNKTWCPGSVVERCSEPRSYIVETPNGTQVRRNRSHLREMMAASKPQMIHFADGDPDPEPPDSEDVQVVTNTESPEAAGGTRTVKHPYQTGYIYTRE
jgi:hypothetical protein